MCQIAWPLNWGSKITTHTCTHNHFMTLWILSGTTRVSQYQKKHSPTHTYHGHQLSLICFIHILRSMASSLFNPHAWQSFSTISLQVFFGLPLGLAHISSPDHCHLFATHAHTIAICFAVVMRLCHPILVSLSILYLEFCLVVSCHNSSNHSHLSTTKIWMQIDTYCQRRKCSPVNVVSSDIRVMQIFAGVHEIWGVKQERCRFSLFVNEWARWWERVRWPEEPRDCWLAAVLWISPLARPAVGEVCLSICPSVTWVDQSKVRWM